MKKAFILLAILAIPAHVQAMPLIPLVIMLGSSSLVAGMMQTYAIVTYWPLAVGLLCFWLFMQIHYNLASPKWGYDYSGTAAMRAKMLFIGAYTALAIGFISLAYFLGTFEYLADMAKEVKG
jgi:hypothetical protein